MSSISKNSLSLVVCALLHGLNHALQLALPPLYLSIRDDIGLQGLGPVMLLSTIYFVVYATMSFPCGFLSDRFNKKKILTFGALLNSVAFLLVAKTSSYNVLVFAMVLAGIGGGTYHPVANALISNIFGGKLGKAFGLIGMGASIGLFAGPFASGLIAQHFGWRTSCFSFALSGCVIAFLFWLFMPEEERVESHGNKSAIPLRELVTPLIPVILVFGFRDFAWWGTTYLTPAMAEVTLGFSKQVTGSLIGFMSLTGILSQPLAGHLSDRIGRRRVLFLALLVSGSIVFFFPHLDPIPIFIAALIYGFLMLGTVPVLDAAAAEIVPPSLRGSLFGVMMTLGIMLGAVSPYFMGLIHDLTGGYTLSYILMGISALIATALVFTIPKKRTYS